LLFEQSRITDWVLKPNCVKNLWVSVVLTPIRLLNKNI